MAQAIVSKLRELHRRCILTSSQVCCYPVETGDEILRADYQLYYLSADFIMTAQQIHRNL